MSVFLTEVFKQSHTESWEKPTDDKVSKLQTVLLSMQEESQATKLLKKERESYKVNTELVAKRTDVQLRLEACRTATKEYEQGQEQLKRIVTENEQFIRNTDIKIEKADRKIREEQDQIQKKEEEIAQLKQQLTDLEDGRLDSEKRIKQNAHIKHFLDSTVKVYEEEFDGEVENLMNRYLTLESGNTELSEANSELTTVLDQQRERWQKEQLKLQNEMLVNNSSLHEYQVMLDRYRAEVADLENQVNTQVEERQIKKSNIGIVHMAIEQLFERAVDSCHLSTRKAAMLDYVESKFGHRLELVLHAITERMEDLQYIEKTARQEIEQRDREERVGRHEEQEIDFRDYKVEVHVDQKAKNKYGNSLHTANLDEFAGVSGSEAPIQQSGNLGAGISVNLAAGGISSKAAKK